MVSIAKSGFTNRFKRKWRLNMEDIIGFLTLAVPFVSMFVFFGWLYKEEIRREQLRIQRNEEWKKEIQKFRDICKKASDI